MIISKKSVVRSELRGGWYYVILASEKAEPNPPIEMNPAARPADAQRGERDQQRKR